MVKGWDELFREVTGGPCPLPEPGDGVIGRVEHPDFLELRIQPRGYNYDKGSKGGETRRYRRQLKNLYEQGKITWEEYQRLFGI